jgi:hypothetical protein
LWLPVSTILAGATLDFVLGDTASTWGGGAADAPPSFGAGQFTSPSDAFNSRGIASDAAPTMGDFDGFGWSYSAEALAAAGVTGSSFTFNNISFPWPAAGSTLDNSILAGQTVAFTTQQKGGTLAFLGSASAGPTSGTGTLRYTDGSTAPFTITFGDWTLGGGAGQPAAGTQIAITTKYRNNNSGQTDPTKTYIFYASVPLDGTKTLASIVMPSMVSAGRLHVFSLALAP